MSKSGRAGGGKSTIYEQQVLCYIPLHLVFSLRCFFLAVLLFFSLSFVLSFFLSVCLSLSLKPFACHKIWTSRCDVLAPVTKSVPDVARVGKCCALRDESARLLRNPPHIAKVLRLSRHLCLMLGALGAKSAPDPAKALHLPRTLYESAAPAKELAADLAKVLRRQAMRNLHWTLRKAHFPCHRLTHFLVRAHSSLVFCQKASLQLVSVRQNVLPWCFTQTHVLL